MIRLGESDMATIQLRQRGTLTIPTSLRRKYQLQDGDSFQLFDLNGVFVLSPMVALVPELAREIERLRVEADLTTEELLVSLREERERIYRERTK